MWKRDSYYSISVEERQLFQYKLETLYKMFGRYIEVLEEVSISQPKDIAYLEIYHNTGEIKMVCGQFWYEEDNILPLVAMTHELGHYYDITQNFDGFYSDYDELSTFEKEVRAWVFAIGFCEEIGITPKYNKEIYFYARKCLKSYYDSLRWEEYLNQDTFDNAMNQLLGILGLEEEPETPEELLPKPSPSFASFLENQLKEIEEMVNGWGLDEEKEDRMTLLERVREQKREWRRNVKRGMKAKSWEL